MEIKIDFEKMGIDKKEIMKNKEKVENIHKDLHARASRMDDFVGWLDLPTNYDKKEFKRIYLELSKLNSLYLDLTTPQTSSKPCFKSISNILLFIACLSSKSLATILNCSIISS